MFKLLKRFIDGNDKHDCSANGKRAQGILIATCALFLEMAQIDGEFNSVEKDTILGILKSEYQLSDQCAASILETAEAELEESIDLWRFTNRINRDYSTEEKIQIVETLWKIIYVDGKSDRHEDYLIHKVANLLHLSHEQLIGAKLKVIGEQ